MSSHGEVSQSSFLLVSLNSLKLDVTVAPWLCEYERYGTVWVVGPLPPQAQLLMSCSHISSLQPFLHAQQIWVWRMEQLEWGILPPWAGLVLAVPPGAWLSSPTLPGVSGALGFATNLFQFVCYFSSGFIYESCVPKCPCPHHHPFSLCFVSWWVFHPNRPNKDTKQRWGTSSPGCRASSRREAPRDKIIFFSLFVRPCCGMFRASCCHPRGSQQPWPALLSP